jgi:nephrocystin-3
MGLMYSQQSGRFDTAIEYYKKALKIKEARYGRCHNECAMTLNNLALVYSKQNRHVHAIPLYKRAASIRLANYGLLHPDIGLFCFNMGVTLSKVHEFPEAIACLELAKRIRAQVYGRLHESTGVVDSWLQYLGATRTQDIPDEKLHKQVLEIINKT